MTNKTNESADQAKFTIRQLMEAGVHFGHKTMRRNPKMSRYIHTQRSGVSIIDLNKTASMLHEALKTVRQIAKNNGRILFVATKKQAAQTVAEAATRCGQYFVNARWLGGMLTNWKTVSQSLKTLKKIEEQMLDEEIGFLKKEKLMLERQKHKLEVNLGGIKNMGGSPDLVFIIDTNKEALALAEAKKLRIPIMAIVDSNCDPEEITYPIPGNDDSAKSIKLYCRLISDAIIEGIRENMVASGIDVSKLQSESIPEKLKELKALENSSEKANKKPDGTKENKARSGDFKKSNLSEKDSKPALKSDKERKPSSKASNPSGSSDSKPVAKSKKSETKAAEGENEKSS